MATRAKHPTPLAGKYKLLDVIGEGAMAVVWRAEMPGRAGPARLVAVKKMKVGLMGGHDYLAMFMEEARVGAELSHPNIVQVFDLCHDDDGVHCLVMEWVPGIDLRGLLRYRREIGKPLPWELATFIVVQALQGLTAAHERVSAAGAAVPVVHCDVSPSNILLGERDGAIKLADFGLARAFDRARSLVGPGVIKGKLAYVAPELTRGERAAPQSDIFAMGGVLWEALACRPLYEGKDEFALLARARDANIRPIRQERPDVPSGLEAILQQALEPQLDRRFASARALATVLTLVLKKSKAPAAEYGPRAVAEAVRAAQAHASRPAGAAPEESQTVELSLRDVESKTPL